ncbi:hypothetical protein BDV06DRAFT_193132 [Aspergillus oleicola]
MTKTFHGDSRRILEAMKIGSTKETLGFEAGNRNGYWLWFSCCLFSGLISVCSHHRLMLCSR